jgi:hypothetical protein
MAWRENVIITANNIKVALPAFSARTATLDQLAFDARLTSIGRSKKNYVMIPQIINSPNARPAGVRLNFGIDYIQPPIFLLGSHNPVYYLNGFNQRVDGFRPTYTDAVPVPVNSSGAFTGNVHAAVFSSYAMLYNWDHPKHVEARVNTRIEWMTLV